MVIIAKPIDREDLRTEIALFRHSLVAPLVTAELKRGELTQELRKIASRKHRIPGTKRKKVSVATLRRWLALLKRHETLGVLKPGLRVDFGSSRAISQEWLKKAIALRIEEPSRSAVTLVEILSRVEGYPGIVAHTLDKVLRRQGLTSKQLRKPGKRIRRWQAEHVNALWQGDATDGVWLPDPRQPNKKIMTMLFVWIDDVSRRVVHAEFFYDEKLPRLERTLKLALLKWGVPSRCYCDNGKVYVALQLRAALAELDIKMVHSRVGQPRGRGKVERVIRTIQSQFYTEAYKAEIKTLGELNEALWAWLERVYHQRLHRGIDITPAAAWRQGEQHVKAVDPVKLARAFLWRFQRTVSDNGFISLWNNLYSVDPAWCKQRIELRCDPFDLSRVDVYRDRRPVARATVEKLKRAYALHLEPLVAAPPMEPSGIDFLDAVVREHQRQLAAEIGEVSFLQATANALAGGGP